MVPPISFKLYEDVGKLTLWRAILCEVLGTLLLVFIGCAAAILGNGPDPSGSSSTNVLRIGFTFGLTVMCLVFTLGPVSGCHLNPTVSLAFFVIGRISLVRAVLYSIFQCIGATLGSTFLYSIIADERHGNLGATVLANGVSPAQGFGCEVILTFLFLTLVCACADEGRRNRMKSLGSIPLTLGLCITMVTLMGNPYSGASLNPARSLGPAIVGGCWDAHWIYWAGPLLGGCAGALVYQYLLSSAFHPDIQPSRPPAAELEPQPAPFFLGTPVHSTLNSRRSDLPMMHLGEYSSTQQPLPKQHAFIKAANSSSDSPVVHKRHSQLTTTRSDAPMIASA